MRRQTHKEQMEYLKEYDPITYYEMTDNPTGTNGDNFGCLTFIILVIVVIIFTLFYFFVGKN